MIICFESPASIDLLISVGNLLQCSRAADQLTKKMVNSEIESDYERNVDKNQSKQNSRKTYYHFILPFALFIFYSNYFNNIYVKECSAYRQVSWGSRYFDTFM